MTGWEVQALKEAEDARIWEEINAPDPAEKQMESAAVAIKEAANFLDIATDRLCEAQADLYDTPMESVVEDFVNRIEDIRFELKELASKYERGRRE